MDQKFNAEFGQEEGGDVKRLIATVAICSVLIFGYQAYKRSQAEGEAAAKGDEVPAQVEAKNQAANVQPATGNPTAAQPANPAISNPSTPAQPESKTKVAIEVAPKSSKLEGVRGGYEVEFTSKGAQIAGFILDGYTDNERVDEKTLKAPLVDLVSGTYQGATLFALTSREGSGVNLAPNADYRLVKSDEKEVVYEHTSSGVTLRRTYTFQKGAFTLDHKIDVINNSGVAKNLSLDIKFVGQERPGERESSGLFGAYSDKLAIACKAGDEREKENSDGIKESQTFNGNVTYGAIDRHFFLASVAPLEGETSSCSMTPWVGPKTGKDDKGEDIMTNGVVMTVSHAPINVGPGETKTLTHAGFFGPKQLGLLQTAGHDLAENVDFGWFGMLSRPMLSVLVWLNGFTHNYGWAIVLLTLMMKALTFPLTQKSYVSMQQMKTVAPQLKELQKKYAHDKAKLGQAQMDLYKESGINPMAGCLPMIVQMPIWFALYRTLWNSVELYQQPFMLWINDLSQPDAFYLGGFPILPVLVGVLMLAQTAFQPTPQDQPQMKYIMYLMPVFFGFMMLQMPSGLSVYMITNSFLTMIQQFYIRRKYGTPEANAAAVAAKSADAEPGKKK